MVFFKRTVCPSVGLPKVSSWRQTGAASKNVSLMLSMVNAVQRHGRSRILRPAGFAESRRYRSVMWLTFDFVMLFF